VLSNYRNGKAGVILAAVHEPAALWNICRLRSEGYRVMAVCDGEQALDVFSYCGDKIDLALIDVSVPNISGADVVSRILQVRPDMRFLLLQCDKAERLDTAARPERTSLHKPFTYDELLAGVRFALHEGLKAMAAG
jgi:DNA-binding response OmpR family regulator